MKNIDKQPYVDKLREQINDKLDALDVEHDDSSKSTRPMFLCIIEDNDLDYKLLQKVSQEVMKDCEIKRFRNGYEAIRYFEEDNRGFKVPDLLIVDLRTPKIDGESVINYLRSHNHTAWMPIFVVSSLKEKEEAVASDRTVFITKPISVRSFSEALACFSNFWWILH